MPIFGTIVNGEVKYDRPVDFPEGARVALALQDGEEDMGLLLDNPQETYEEYLASLRACAAEVRSGVRLETASEVFDEIEKRIQQRVTNEA